MQTEKKRVEEFAQKINNKEFRMRYVLGAFGDMEECVGIVEEEVFPEEGGSFVKYLGCSYLQKGCVLGVIPLELIECYGLAKKILIKTITDIFKDKLLLFFIFLFWLFKRKKFYFLLNGYIGDICDKTITMLMFDEKRYNKAPAEYRRATKEAFKKELGIEIEKTENPLADKKLRLYFPIYKLTELVIFLTDFDTAYKYSIQDAFSELDKTNDPIKELERIMDIIVKRSHPGFGIEPKVKAFKRAIGFLRLFPPFKRMLYYFFQELDIEKIKMDEADWYWCLRRHLYNFKDVPIEKRLEEAKKIDKEKGHIKIKFTPTISEEEFNEKSGLKKG